MSPSMDCVVTVQELRQIAVKKWRVAITIRGETSECDRKHFRAALNRNDLQAFSGGSFATVLRNE